MIKISLKSIFSLKYEHNKPINVKHCVLDDFDIVEDILTELWCDNGLATSK